jgi:transcriptional regulator with XRE-family HTH domain
MLREQEFVTASGAETVPTVNTSKLPIGKALKVERTVADLDLGKVAEAAGISAGHLSHIEAGERKASPELIARIRIAIAELGEATA